MIPFSQDLSTVIPFDLDDLIDLSQVTIITQAPVEDNYVHKASLPPSVLNPKFLDYLEQRDLDIEKIVVWHWLTKNPHIAHIDSNQYGVVLPSAINWTLTSTNSRVQFYDLPNVKKVVMQSNEASAEWTTNNLTSYIPIDVSGIDPVDTWDTKGPCLINTSVPHLVVAPEIRTSVSLQLKNPRSFDVILEKIVNG
jgi:hypothetical protein